jgi:hypothetical protein
MVIEADDDTQKHLVECKSFRPLGAEDNISLFFCVILVLLVNVMEDGGERYRGSETSYTHWLHVPTIPCVAADLLLRRKKKRAVHLGDMPLHSNFANSLRFEQWPTLQCLESKRADHVPFKDSFGSRQRQRQRQQSHRYLSCCFSCFVKHILNV